MSRVYDALQQCVPGNADPGPLEQNGAGALFSQQFEGSAWDLGASPVVQANLSDDDRVPTLFSTYSFASEQFRLLATRLQQLRGARALKSVLLTSSVAEEGKSLLSMNLAMSLAHAGEQKVLLVEADLRKPSICRVLRLGKLGGIREWYRTNRPITEFIRQIAGLSVWVLPAGLEEVDPLEILNSSRMANLLTEANAAFDWVLLDSSPLLPMADAEIMSRISDATIIVVRRDKTPKGALKQALERVAPAKLLGFMLNEFPINPHYGYERYSTEQPADPPAVGQQLQRA
jgi:capsular exopolysaccharide synthesis family protein